MIKRPTEADKQENAHDQFVCACSEGFNKGIHEFKIKCTKPKQDAIGIITNINACSDETYDDKHIFWISRRDFDSIVYAVYGRGLTMKKLRGESRNRTRNFTSDLPRLRSRPISSRQFYPNPAKYL